MLAEPIGSRARALVTGVAGFIGSTLAERLVADDFDVVGVDAFTDYYDPRMKERNLERLRDEPRFALHRGDLLSMDLDAVLEGIDVVYHQAGQPGVRLSWSDTFRTYSERNVAFLPAYWALIRSSPVGAPPAAASFARMAMRFALP